MTVNVLTTTCTLSSPLLNLILYRRLQVRARLPDKDCKWDSEIVRAHAAAEA